MSPQQIKYLGPKIKITIGDLFELTENVREYHVWSSRIDFGDICEFVVADFSNELKNGLTENMLLTIEWGYKGFDFEKIFTGLISRFKSTEPKLIKIRGVDCMKHLFDAQITKTYQDERPTSIIINLIEDLNLALDTSGVIISDLILDKLPLYQDHIVHAVRTINHRLNLDYHLWFDIDGVLHWAPLSIPDEATWTFIYGENIIDLQPKDNGKTFLLTVGMTVRHGDRVMIIDRDEIETEYFVEKAHYYQEQNKGSRTGLLLSELEQ